MRILFRAIRTRSGYPNWAALKKELEQEIDKVVKPEILAYFNEIVKDWKHRPEFKARKSVTAKEIGLYVYAAGKHADIWKWVSVTGTKRHKIRPKKKGGTLRFNWAGPGSYKARTTTSGGYKGPGKSTGPLVAFKEVTHPGFPARHFEQWVARWYGSKHMNFRCRMENAMRRGLRKL